MAQFLREVRSKWSEKFILRRNSIEHQGWSLPPVEYKILPGNKVEIIEPEVDGMFLSFYSKYMLNRVMSFIENIVLYAFKSTYEPPIVITEIPINQRRPECPKRFFKELRIPGKIESRFLEWDIRYSEDDFEFQ